MKLEKMKLPDKLSTNLQSVEKHWVKVQATSVTFLSLTVFLLSLVLLYVSDRLWDTVPTFRVILMGVTIVSFLTALLSYLKRKSDYTSSPYKLIKLVQKHFSSLGDSLQGAVELSDDSTRPNTISSGLCQAAIIQVADKTADLNFSESVKTANRNRFTRYFVILALTVVVFFVIEPRAIVNTFERWINPFSSQARYTFVELNELPLEKIVLHGESFSLDVSVKEDSSIKPKEVYWKFKGLSKNAVKLQDGKVKIDLPGQTVQTTLTISANDFSRSIIIKPVHSPALKEVLADIQMPSYLKQANLNFEVQGNSLEMIQGSEFTLEGLMTNPLVEAKFYQGKSGVFEKFDDEVTVAETEKILSDLLIVKKIAPALSLVVDGAKFRTGQLDPHKSNNLLFTWKDHNGFSQKEPYRLQIISVEDTAPVVDCENMRSRSFHLLVSENFIFPIKARDNFGVKYIKMEYSVQGSDNSNFSKSFMVNVKNGSESSQELKSNFIFSPNQMNIPAGSTVTLYAVSNDYLPGRKNIKSPKYKIYILSKQEHAQEIQRRFEDLTSKLEGVAMQEDENMQKNKLIAQMTPEELNSEKGKEAIEESLAAEEANAKRMKELTKEGMELIKEALKNDEFNEEELKEWSEMMKSLEELSDEEMQDVQKSLAEAGKPQEGPKSNLRLEGLQAAIKKQEEVLRKLRRLSKELDEDMKNASLKNFASRLRNLATQETESSTLLQQLFVQAIGLSFNDLPDKLKALNDKIFTRQKSINQNILLIKMEMLSFYARTKIEKYKTVTDDMEDKKATEGLKALLELIESNKTSIAIKQAKVWAKQIEAWADMLQPKKESKPGEGQPQEPKEQDMEFLMALIRVIEQEQNLHEETLFLETKKKRVAAVDKEFLEKNKTQKELAQRQKKLNKQRKGATEQLAERQEKNMKDLEKLTKQLKKSKITDLMDGAESAMDEAMRALKENDTSVKATSAEMAAVELLISIFDGGGSGSSSGSAAMAMMMEMMGQGQGQGSGNSPGGNSSGGPATNPVDVNGDKNGRLAADRDNKKYSINLDEIPVEFRDALESYYKEVEENF